MITVIGSINLDLIATVDRLPGPGETVPGSGFKTAPGGKGANQALAAARAGATVRMVGAVGKDAFAAEALALPEGRARSISPAWLKPHARTGIALILVDGDGENVIAVVPGANDTVLPAIWPRPDSSRATSCSCSTKSRSPPSRRRSTPPAAAGAVTVLNTAPFRAEAADLLGKANYVVANETEFDLYGEALALSGRDRAGAHARLRRRAPAAPSSSRWAAKACWRRRRTRS